MNLYFLDFESYYDKDYSLRKMSTPEYILDVRWEMILCAVQEGYNEPYIVDGPDFARWAKSVDWRSTATVSHNALFDNSILAWRYGAVPVRMFDTLGMARALRGHVFQKFDLGYILKELGIGQKGDTIAKVLGLHRADIISKGMWPEFCRYALTDVRGCANIFFSLIREFPIGERRFMDLVLRTTIQPQFVADSELLAKHYADVLEAKNEGFTNLGLARQANGKPPRELMSTDGFAALLTAQNVEIEYKISPTGNTVPAFAKSDDFMNELLEHENPIVRRLAEARLECKSTLEETRTKRFLSISRLPWKTGANMPMPLAYGKPHTHRLSGDWKLNVQNMPTTFRSKGKSKLRASLKAPEGYVILAADLGQIECRLGAWLCHCETLLDQFRRGEDVYASYASRVFGYPVNRKAMPFEGAVGKTGVLGLGYGCGEDKFLTMLITAARGGGFPEEAMTPELAKRCVQAFRKEEYPEFQRCWWGLDNALNTAWLGKGPAVQFRCCTISEGAVSLPNGLFLRYADPCVDAMGEKWFRHGRWLHKLYGAKFLENIDQALARIVLSDAAIRLADRHNLRFALQLHDELVFVIPQNELDNVSTLVHSELTRAPGWALDLPLKAEIKVGYSYGDLEEYRFRAREEREPRSISSPASHQASSDYAAGRPVSGPSPFAGGS